MCYLNAVRFLYGFNKTTEEIRNNYYEEVYNNNIFRLEKNDKNLASQVLALFRKRVQKDMQRKYNVNIRAILSLTYGTNEFGIVRTGKCYLADNWKFLCLTKGMRIHHGFGRDGEAAEWNVVKDGEKKSFFIYDFRKRKR
jgi:hypothetical protein